MMFAIIIFYWNAMDNQLIRRQQSEMGLEVSRYISRVSFLSYNITYLFSSGILIAATPNYAFDRAYFFDMLAISNSSFNSWFHSVLYHKLTISDSLKACKLIPVVWSVE